MNPNLASTYVTQSPKRTGMLIFAVSVIVLGGGLVIKYLVDKSREAEGYPPAPSGDVKALLDKLGSFGQVASTPTSSSSTQGSGTMIAPIVTEVPDDVGCNSNYKKRADVNEVPDGITAENMAMLLTQENLNKCGIGVYEFQTYVRETTGINMPIDGQYGSKTREAHKKWLKQMNLV
jgi:hypothetical protein